MSDDLDRRPPRLIDDQGRVWSRPSPATGRQVRQFLGRPQRVAVRDHDAVTSWLSQDDARALWRRIRRHVAEPGGHRMEPDADGLIYQAGIWCHEERRLLGFEFLC